MKHPSDRIRDAGILIVDDKVENIFLLEELLVREGYGNVVSTTDPTEVARLHARHDYDAILLDVRMPVLSGLDVLRRLADLGGDDYPPVIVLTAQTDAETRRQALALGARDFLTKPFDRTEVLLRLRNMLEVRLLHKAEHAHAALLEAQVRERTGELHATQMEIVRRLGVAGEYRDNETGLHVVRMSRSCHHLALLAGLGEATADLLLHASPMHDVGKIGIPDFVLLKAGKLAPDEWEIMKRHVEIGARIIGDHPAEIMQFARTIALTHHERWDGGGYPRGLGEQDIPLVGRVAALCDVFDALMSIRPYKPAWPLEKVVAHIGAGAGTQFDPTLARVLLDNVGVFADLQDQFRDQHGETIPA